MRKARPRKPGTIINNDNYAKNRLGQMLRVDHAGEMAAVEIYKAQLKVFSNASTSSNIEEQLKHQESDEIVHKSTFDEILIERDVRPTLLEPIWKPAAQFLGYATALISEKATHACTAAVEEVIQKHYEAQEEEIGDNEKEIKDIITKFKDEEVAHKNDAIANGAKEGLGHPILEFIIKSGCKTAIKLSEKI